MASKYGSPSFLGPSPPIRSMQRITLVALLKDINLRKALDTWKPMLRVASRASS